jgi:uncharacterized damage-inducible protein DinB
MGVPKTFTLRCGDRNQTQEAATGTHVLSDDLHHDANAAYVAKQMGNSPEMVFGVYAKWIKGADKGRERDKVNAALREFVTEGGKPHVSV